MWIKICANTNLTDALLAAELGADAVGFVFAPSARQVTPADVALITPHLPSSIERIGVFPALSADDIARAAHLAHLTAVQLHGGVDLALIEQLHQLFAKESEDSKAIDIIQTVPWLLDSDSSTHKVAQQLNDLRSHGLVRRVLIDSSLGQRTGGTGVPFDWNAAQTVFAHFRDHLNLIVAGGLRPSNVAQAILGLNPWGVDVASGVELVPGRKDPAKLASLISEARAAKPQPLPEPSA
jgi:phosphoribosylanthranilate isomerase